MSAILNFIVRDILYKLTNNSSSYWLSIGSIWTGCVIGIIIPLFSNVLPIQSALGKNLRESLDLYHRSANSLTVQVISL